MEKFVTYNEKELKERLRFLEVELNNAKDWVRLMQEQASGKRTNITIEDSARRLVCPLDNIESVLKSFNIL